MSNELSESEPQSSPHRTQRQALFVRLLSAIEQISDGNLHRVAAFAEAIQKQQQDKRTNRSQHFSERTK